MISIRPVSDLRNKFTEIENAVSGGEPVFLTKKEIFEWGQGLAGVSGHPGDFALPEVPVLPALLGVSGPPGLPVLPAALPQLLL